jgi:hypothetical protein
MGQSKDPRTSLLAAMTMNKRYKQEQVNRQDKNLMQNLLVTEKIQIYFSKYLKPPLQNNKM